MTTCDITGWEMDFAVPERMNLAVWSWDTGHPYNWGKGSDCALMKGADGRWVSSNCNKTAFYACVHKNNPYDWKISDEKGAWDEGDVRCKKFGPYKLGLPFNGYQNYLIHKRESVIVIMCGSITLKGKKQKNDSSRKRKSKRVHRNEGPFCSGFYKIKK